MWIQFSKIDGSIRCTCSDQVAEPITGYINGQPEERGQMEVDDNMDISLYYVDINQNPPVLIPNG